MKKKRERLDVVHDILRTVQSKEKIGPTRLLQLSNLSPLMFKEYIEELTSNGLLEETRHDSKKFFVVTDKGCRFLEEYKVFTRFVSELGL